MKSLEAQFQHPSGFAGYVAGKVMGLANRKVARWTVAVLEIQPGDRILEISFGPGVALKYADRHLGGNGFAAGVDPSITMVHEARRRNRSAIRTGRIGLLQGYVSNLPFSDELFHKAFSVNSIQIWPNPAEDLAEIRRVLQPDGLLAVSLQDRRTRAENARREKRSRLADHFEKAGFYDVTWIRNTARRVPAFCVIGRKLSRPGVHANS